MKRTNLAIALFHITTLALGLFVIANPGRAAGLVVVDNPPLVVDATANTASGWLLLQNASGAVTNFTLSAGAFVSLTTSNSLGTKINLSTSGTPYLVVKEMAAGSNLAVKVEVLNFLDGGEAVAPLHLNGAVVGALRAERSGAPFNVTVEGTPAEKPEVMMEPGTLTSLILRNGDAVHYRVQWEFEADRQVVSNGVALLPALSTVRVAIEPDSRFFGWGICGWIKDEVTDGRLIVRWEGPGGTVKREKVMPLRVKVKPVGDLLRGVGIVLLLVVLTLGAVCSLALNNGIPNQTRRLDLRDELEVLTTRIHDLTPQIDSAVRVLMRVERSRLAKLLESRWSISPDLVNVFKTVSAGIATLKRQLDVLERMDALYDQVEILRGGVMPPTVMELALQKLDQSCKLVHATAPPDADLQAAQTLVAEAAVLLDNAEKPNELVQLKLAKRVKELRAQFNGALTNDPLAQQFKKSLANLFEAIASADLEVPANITPDLYARLDARTRRLQLLAEYVMLGKNEMADRERAVYVEYETYLTSAVRRDGLAALEHGQRVVQHLKEGIFTGQLIQAIQGNQARVVTDLSYPRANDAIEFRVTFTNTAYNDATARQSLICEWNFGDGLTEKGWVVTHYFRNARDYDVTTQFFHKDKEPFEGPRKVVSVNAAPVEGTTTGGWFAQLLGRLLPFVDPRKLTARTRIELLRVAIALGAALLALYGGAREQFAQLDCLPGLVAVFLAGFGADTIKNLLTQKP